MRDVVLAFGDFDATGFVSRNIERQLRIGMEATQRMFVMPGLLGHQALRCLFMAA